MRQLLDANGNDYEGFIRQQGEQFTMTTATHTDFEHTRVIRNYWA